MRVLVTGATGYIGGRLVPRLLERGHGVRVLVRDPVRAQGRRWVRRVEVFEGDLSLPETLENLFEDIDVAYYLVHSMYGGRDFAERDREAAHNFRAAACGLAHVVYLGGLKPEGDSTPSEHLASRAEIGAILADGVPLTEFRAGPIIGSGSASFELLRYTTERLPLMIVPNWVRNAVHPIAVRDVLSYLIGAAERGPSGIVEIGAEPQSYHELMQTYARLRGLRRWVVPIPAVLPAWIGAGWLGLVTPIPNSLTVPLAEGMERPLCADTARARALFPAVEPIGHEKALRLALLKIRARAVETHWTGSSPVRGAYAHWDVEGLMGEEHSRHVEASPEVVFRVLTGLGGDRGWPMWRWPWRLRGALDRLAGGKSPRRGRRDPYELLPGEAVDFWRAEVVEAPRHLRLGSGLVRPGSEWIEWRLEPERGGTRLHQTVSFVPRGLPGVLWWYVFKPLRRLLYTDLIRGIRQLAVQAETAPGERSFPHRTRNVWGDTRAFILKRPELPTRMEFATTAEREQYSVRIMQRLGIDVTSYSVLNLHQIGVDAPVRYVFEEIRGWDGDSTCWPNHLAQAERVEGRVGEHLRVRPLGIARLPFGSERMGWNVKPLFELKAIRFQESPPEGEPDNARYLLYACAGGYPIGIFTLYVRASIPDEGEVGRSQVFLGVGFDFFGRQELSHLGPVGRAWEALHDRVTANVLNRFKDLCEWRFERTQAGA